MITPKTKNGKNSTHYILQMQVWCGSSPAEGNQSRGFNIFYSYFRKYLSKSIFQAEGGFLVIVQV